MRLEELRSTLAEHADGIEDHPQARIAPVHQRITVARRRRKAVVASVVAAAVAAVALAVVPPFVLTRDLAPAGGDAPAQLAGRAVPRTQVATGFTYLYVRGYQSGPGARSLDVSVPEGGQPKLVMWASSDSVSRPVVRLAGAGDRAEVSSAGGFGRYALLPSYDDGRPHPQRLHLTQRGAGKDTRLGLAVYELAGLPTSGVGNGTIVFRKQVAGEPLLKAVVGKPGQDDLRFRVRVPATDVSFSYSCYASTRWFTVSVGGEELLGSQCRRHPDMDAGAVPATFDRNPFPRGTRPGDVVELRIHLSPRAKPRDVVRDPDVVLGLGLYRNDGPHHRILGMDLSDRVEYDGHDWLAGRWDYSPTGARSLRLHLPVSDRPRLVTWVGVGTADERNRIMLGQSPRPGAPVQQIDEYESVSGLASSGSGYVVQPGESPDVVVQVLRGGTSRTRLALVISDQLR